MAFYFVFSYSLKNKSKIVNFMYSMKLLTKTFFISFFIFSTSFAHTPTSPLKKSSGTFVSENDVQITGNNSDCSYPDFSDVEKKKLIKVVAAENFYGNVAQLIAGEFAEIISVINNTSADPHLFVTSPRTAVTVKKSDLVILNGADYDPWIQPFLDLKKDKEKIIDVSSLIDVSSDRNPHIWYKPETFLILAKKLTEFFSKAIPSEKNVFESNLKIFLDDYQQVDKLISAIRSKHSGRKVTATEPIFGYMAKALGLIMVGEDFQWLIMNDSEPTPKMLIKQQKLLSDRNVSVLFYNEQVQSVIALDLLRLAKQNNIPVVGLVETMPPEENVITWLINILTETQSALETCDHG